MKEWDKEWEKQLWFHSLILFNFYFDLFFYFFLLRFLVSGVYHCSLNMRQRVCTKDNTMDEWMV